MRSGAPEICLGNLCLCGRACENKKKKKNTLSLSLGRTTVPPPAAPTGPGEGCDDHKGLIEPYYNNSCTSVKRGRDL